MFRIALLTALLVVLGTLAYSYRAYFLINDVTTTPAAPPHFQAIEGVGEYPPENAAVQRRYQQLKPLTIEQPADAVFAQTKQIAANQLNWEIISVDAEGRRIEATATTPLMRFKDDVVIEVRSEGDQSATVHMRSKSRLGRGDLGANAARIKQFLDAMTETSRQQQG